MDGHPSFQDFYWETVSFLVSAEFDLMKTQFLLDLYSENKNKITRYSSLSVSEILFQSRDVTNKDQDVAQHRFLRVAAALKGVEI